MRAILALILSFTLFAQSAMAHTTDPTLCEARLLRHALGSEGEARTEAQQWAHYIIELQQAYYSRLWKEPDPFIHCLTLETAQRKFDILSTIKNSETGEKTPSILGNVRQFFVHNPHMTLENSKEMLKRVAEYSQKVLADPEAKNIDLYRGSVSIELLAPALAQAIPIEQEQRKIDEKKNPEGKTKEEPKGNEQEPGQEQPPEYPNDMGDYKPHNKDTDKGRGKSKLPPVVVAEINEPNVSHWIMGFHNSVVRGAEKPMQKAPLPGQVQPLPEYSPTAKRLTLNLTGKSEGPVLLPPGWIPTKLPPGHPAKLERRRDGSFYISGVTTPSIELSVMKDKEFMRPEKLEFLTRPVGVADHEWPSEIRFGLLETMKGKSRREIAQAVESYLRNEFLYKVDADDTNPDPIDMIKAGSFQCDMAYYIMVAIMRDYFKIPCRPAYGFRGTSPLDNPGVSQVKLPTDQHAFVQCFDEAGMPELYDPTPRDLDREKEEQEKKKREDRDNNKEYNDYKVREKKPKEGKGVEDNSEEHKKTLEKNTQERLKQIEQEKNGSGSSSGKQGQDHKDDKQPEQHKQEQQKDQKQPDQPQEHHDSLANAGQEMQDAMRGGTASLLPKEDKIDGLLDKRARHLYLREALNPENHAEDAAQAVNNFKYDSAGKAQYIQPVIRQAELANLRRQGPVVDTLFALSGNLRKQPVLDSFNEILQIEDRMRLFAQMQDPQNRPKFDAHVAAIGRIKAEFAKLNDQNKIATGMAQKFWDGLPSHARDIVGEDYHLDGVGIGQNIETQNMMTAITNGSLTQFNLMRVLYPLTNFILDSTHAPATRELVQFEHDPRYHNGKEWLPATDLSRARQGVRTNPHQSIYRSMREGNLWLPGVRKRIQVPDPGGVTQPKRVTIGLYDTSGSMNGNPGNFQAALLASFVDRALSDRVGGLHRHKVMLMGFDSKVHSRHPVINSEQARDVIRNYRSKMANTNQGTDILAAIKEAVDEIVAAEERAGEPLASANIILMTDGEDEVSAEDIQKELSRRKYNKTPIKMLFVAIGKTNRQLIQTRENALKAGAQEALYVEFTNQQIDQLMEEGREVPDVDLDRELYTNATAAALPQDLERRMNDLASAIRSDLNALKIANTPTDLRRYLQDVNATQINPDNRESTDIKNAIGRVRGLMARSDVLRRNHFADIMFDDVMKNFRRTFGKPWSPLMAEERAEIIQMLEDGIHWGSNPP